MEIRIAKENKNINGFFNQRGFIELIENEEIVAISSGWECNGYLYVYRYNEKAKKWVGNWEGEDTFPYKEALQKKTNFDNEESKRVIKAKIIKRIEEEFIKFGFATTDLKEVAIATVDEISKCCDWDNLNDEVELEITSDNLKWNECNSYPLNDEESNNCFILDVPSQTTSNGFQFCMYHYDPYWDDSASQWDKDTYYICVYIPSEYGTNDEKLIKIIKNMIYNIGGIFFV